MTLEMHRGKMHMIPRDWDPGRVPECEMLQEDEAELNVMDFVETEYKSENNDEARMSKRKLPKEKKNRSKKCWGVSVETVNDSRKETKAKNNRKKFRATQKAPPSLARSYSDSDLAVVCPYATCLKILCDRIGTIQDPVSEPLPPRLFNQLKYLEVHYPYAALLKELYLDAQAESKNIPSMRPVHDCQDLEVVELMKSLNYKTGVKSKSSKHSHANTTDFETPCSTILLALVLQLKNYNTKGNWNEISKRRICELNGIGKILHNSMIGPNAEDLPLSEFHSSALLHRISLSIQQKASCAAGASLQNDKNHNHTTSEQSTTESSHSEADDLDWKPNRSRKKAANGLPNTKRRKSERRKKKSQSNPSSSKRENIATLNQESVCAKELDCKDQSDSVAPSRLLQLIISKDQEKLSSCHGKQSARNLRVKNENRAVTKDQGKVKEFKGRSRKAPGSKSQRYQVQREVAVSEGTKTKVRNSIRGSRGSSMSGKGPQEGDASGSQVLVDSNASEQQSLLKEYLLKPAGEEIKTENDCDMPKVETNFLFSRMLQNFKILAEANHSESISEREQETQSVPDILREMLVSGNTDGELQTDVNTQNDLQDDKNLIKSVLLQCPQTNLSDKKDPSCKVECDNSVICKIECEEDICKVEHEEDCFECQVCHLQFSSAIDLSTHQVLFHCSEDPEASSTQMLLSHSADNLKSNALQKKLPA
ncbi:uncharacterized protein LOC122249366 [Penaeus japonicus]|uniref:uncharacterized protein LOC122249366 n=1 Tax=Penaeus japonicus TaxID=27405 RepID=UPI001C70E666|nr:uncharacterized protein LOC122249366 [Penaeus japonicus]